MAEIKRPVGRPKGSTKKSITQNRGGIFNIKMEKQVEGASVNKDSSMGWVRWGAQGDYPLLMLDLYNQSPTHNSCINFEVQSICAGGIDYEAMGWDKSQMIPNYQYSWDYLLRAIALDYSIFGSYAVEIILNKDRKTLSYWHIPMEKVRCSPYDEDGQITSYWISSDWTAIGQNPPFKIDAFDMREDTKIEYGKPYLYVYRPYDPTCTYYQSPFYASGIKAIQSEIEYLNFDIKSITNGFVPSGMLVLNEVETDEERQAIIKNVTNLFTGSQNANSLMISFRSNIEEQAPTFVPFTTNASNVNLYDAANKRTIDRILCSHQITNASLIGAPDLNNNGFASEAAKMEAAYQLYERLTGNYHRQCVVETFNHMLALNGIDTELIIKPLHFIDYDETIDNQPNETDTTDEKKADNSSNNTEEKKDGENNKE